MYSFYGGQPGYSFIIVASYKSVQDMINNFKLGSDYTAVHFDEHVLINTDNKNDPDNGKIYRRGYDFNNEMGGAEFVGTIVGPSGNSPILKLTTIAEVQDKYHSAGEGIQERYSQDSYTVAQNNLVPGKYIDENQQNAFNDEIEWASYSVRDINNNDTTAYIGFKIPYPVIDFTTKSIDCYDENRNYDGQPTIERTDINEYPQGTHPFYEKWQIGIPKGIKGDSVGELGVQVADDSIEYYEGRQNDIDVENQVLVYKLHNYDNSENGSERKIYLGPYRAVDNITIEEHGNVVVHYTHTPKQETFERVIKSIDSLSLSSDGTLTINYNTEEHNTVSGEKIKWIERISSAANGRTVIFYFNDGTSTDIDLDIDDNNRINIDTSLTQRGASAESYTVGKIAESLGDINNFLEKNVIIVNKTTELPENISENRLPLRTGDALSGYQGIVPGYLDSFGNLQPSSEYWTTDFIPIFTNHKEDNLYPVYYLFGYLQDNDIIATNIKTMMQYDINYNYIGTYHNSNNPDYDVKNNGRLHLNGGQRYIRFSFHVDENFNWNTAMFLISSTEIERDPNVYIENNIKEKVIFKKNYKILAFGDGVLGGAGNAGDSYFTMTCNKLNINYINNAINNATLAHFSQTPPNDYLVPSLIDEILTYYVPGEISTDNIDLIYVAITSNDWYFNQYTTLGTFQDALTNANNATFYGALFNMCQELKTWSKENNIPCIVATPLKKWIEREDTSIPGNLNYNSKALSEWRDAVIQVCEYCGIPVFDLYSKSMLNPWIATDRQNYMVDGGHPNNLGHQQIAINFEVMLRQYLPNI